MQKFEELFYGTIGTRKTDPVDFELKKIAKPMHLRNNSVPKVHKKSIKRQNIWVY